MRRTKKIQKQNMKKIQIKKTKKIQKQNMKKGGWLEDEQKKNCTNYKDGKNIFTIKDENDNDITFGDGEIINKIRAENLSMFPNNTCFLTKTMASYIRYLLVNEIGPGHAKFVTPTEPKVQIDSQMLQDFSIVPKELVEAFNVVVDTDYRPPDVKVEEERLRCILIGSDKLYRFVSDMWFNLIQKALGLPTLPDGTAFMKVVLEKIGTHYHVDYANKTTDPNVITKPGYLCGTKNNCTEILKLQTADEFYEYNMENNISFLQLMGAFYHLPLDPDLIKGLIDTDEDLQYNFMSAIQLFFSVPDTMTYAEYSKIIDKSYNRFPMFHSWVYTFLVNRKNNLIHQLKAGDDDVYIRRRTKDDLFKTPVKDIKCKEKQFDNYNNPNLELIFGNSYVTPRDNGIWYNTLKLYEKQMIAGPSGSTVYLYQIIFDLSKILEKNETNEIMLLMAILADYTGIYHSTTEILQVYAEESSFIEEKYNLGMNDTKYIRDLMIKVGIYVEAAPAAAADTGDAVEAPVPNRGTVNLYQQSY